MALPSLPRTVEVPAPAAPRFGLESVITWLPSGDPKVFMGVQFQAGRCDAARLTSALQCDDGESPFGVPKESARTYDLIQASPFAIYGEDECNPVGRSTSEAFERARRHLETGRGRAIERAVQFGEAGNEPTLVGDSVDITPAGGAVSLRDAIGRAEQYLAENYGGIGVLHMDRRTVAHAMTDGLIFVVGDQLQTVFGTLVAAGGGYDLAVGPGEDPDESPAVGHWIYVTGAVYGWRSDVEDVPGTYSGSINTGTNTQIVLAEQVFVVAWECVSAAIQVDPDGLE